MIVPRLPNPRESGSHEAWGEALIRVLQVFMQEVAASIGDGRQAAIQFRDEGVNLGTSGTANVMNFVGTGVTVTRTGNTITVTIGGGPPISIPILTEGDVPILTEDDLQILVE